MISRLYSTAQILSLDIVIGAVVLLRFFCIQLEVQVSWQTYFLLGSTIWLIYTLDHIQDAEKAPGSTRARYIFHRKYKFQLVFLAVCLILLMVPVAFFIPLAVLMGGLILGLLSLIYLIIHAKLSRVFSKELYVALIYSLGILMVPMLMAKAFKLETFVLLVLLSFTNLVLFSWFEERDDAIDGFDSIATQMGRKKLERLVILLVSIGVAISVLRLDRLHIFFLVGFTTYSLMIIFPKWFRLNNKYRSLGDSVFLWPIVFEWA